MPRLPDAMPEGRAVGATALRTVGFVLAIGLGIVSVWLIVTSDSVKMMRIGALAGFWGLLLGGFSIFGRHLQHPAGTAVITVSELAVRGPSALERPEDAASRRDFERQLMSMLRHEVQATMTGEFERMREEVALLRSELVEKVHGDLRMERIETTRVFGSDIEALQQEINQLKSVKAGSGNMIEAEEWAAEPIVEAEIVADEPKLATEPDRGVEARTVDERPAPPPAHSPKIPQPQEWPTVVLPAPAPYVSAAIANPDTVPPEPLPVVQAPAADAFADLPRLRPFTEFSLDSSPLPVPPAVPAVSQTRSGRRRAAEDEDTAAATSGGRRRREGPSSGNDLLSQILARENKD